MHRIIGTCRKGFRFWFPRNAVETHSKEEARASTAQSTPGCCINEETKASIFQALGWSGVMALGWQLFQPIRYFLSYRSRNDRCGTDCVSLDVSALLRAAWLNNYVSLSNAVLPESCSVSRKSRHSKKSSKKHQDLSKQLEIAKNELKRAEDEYIREVSLENGVGWYKRGGREAYEEAAGSWKIALRLGSSKAAFYLGFLHQYGLGEDRDMEKAIDFYTIAAESGHARAMYQLGELLLTYKSDEDKQKRGGELLVKAATQGVSDATQPANLTLEVTDTVQPEEIESNFDLFEPLRRKEGNKCASSSDVLTSEGSSYSSSTTSSHSIISNEKDSGPTSLPRGMKPSMSSPQLSCGEETHAQPIPYSKSVDRLSSLGEEGGYFSASDELASSPTQPVFFLFHT